MQKEPIFDKRIENVNILAEEEIMTPDELKALYVHSEKAIQTVISGQTTVKNILDRKDHRLFIVVGPCSIHDVDMAMEYAIKLKKLADEVDDTLYLVMRVYFEKPRTNIGWQGLINDPYMDGSCIIEDGLKKARKLLLDIAELGLPSAGEALDLISPQYVQDLISWTAIGARTTESQCHRKMASGFSSAVGFKNGTDGYLSIAINALKSMQHENNFLSVNPPGNVSIVRTKGNDYGHIVLRGGKKGPNYDRAHIAEYEMDLRKSGFPENIMVDCSHDNSANDPAKQSGIMDDISKQILQGNKSIIGLMIESNLEWGSQSIPEDLTTLKYGISVTDACIDWAETEKIIKKMRNKLKVVLSERMQK